MANPSHVFLRLAAVLPVAALLWSCQSGGQQPFRYPESLPAQASAAPQGKAPALVEITSDCQVTPEWAVVSVKLFNRWNPSSNVLWHAIDKQDGDRVVISAKPVNEPEVLSLFQAQYEITGSFDAIRSGAPKKALKLLEKPRHSVVWKYQVDYYRDDKLLCTRDPDVCIRKVGSTECQAP
jgi:hypothetical protein